MQYVRNISDSVSAAWGSINPATLSGAIDVIVVEQEDGTLVCSPFHVRFGKFQLLRPYEKKVEFRVNGVKQNYAMKLGEGGEAFFVFETSDTIPLALQTSPLASPASSPHLNPEQASARGLQEPEPMMLDADTGRPRRPPPAVIYSSSAPRDNGLITPLSTSPDLLHGQPKFGEWTPASMRPHSDDVLRRSSHTSEPEFGGSSHGGSGGDAESPRSHSPPPLPPRDALERAIALSKELSAVNIPSQVTETGDLMLDMRGFKSREDDAFRAEIMARKILAEELDGNYDIGALFGMDEQGNLWIYSSEEAKEAAMKRTVEAAVRGSNMIPADAASDPGYQSDGSDVTTTFQVPTHRRAESDLGAMSIQPETGTVTAGDPNLNYAKTLRLTSDQLKALDLKSGENHMSFTVNRSTCQAYMFLWKFDTPVVISDIDGTITKSDAWGHILNMVGRDWTHIGVAKLYTDVVNNGYNIMYLTSRSVGQADTTRAYLNGIQQGTYRLPRGPTILSPDRTMAALRREIYLRQPHVFKMSTLRDIRHLYGADQTPFYAGFGNRITDQISYRTVEVPRSRIFTINSNAEVVLDLLSLNKLKMSYVNINEVVDHYFPPVSTLVKGGGEEYTDFMYWRDTPLELDEFSASGSEVDEDEEPEPDDQGSQYAEEEYGEDDEEAGEGLGDSYISQASVDEGSVLSGGVEGEEQMMSSILEEEDDADDEGEEDDAADGPSREDTQVVIDPVTEASATAATAAAAAVDKMAGTTTSGEAKTPSGGEEVVEDVSAEVITGVQVSWRGETGIQNPTSRR